MDELTQLAVRVRNGDDGALLELAGRTYALALETLSGWRVGLNTYLPGKNFGFEDLPWLVTREVVLEGKVRSFRWNPYRQSWASYVHGRMKVRRLDILRRHHAECSLNGDEEWVLRSHPAPEDGQEVVAMYTRAMELLSRMATPGDLWVLEAVCLEERMTYGEAAATLKTRPGTLKARVSRLRARIRDDGLMDS